MTSAAKVFDSESFGTKGKKLGSTLVSKKHTCCKATDMATSVRVLIP